MQIIKKCKYCWKDFKTTDYKWPRDVDRSRKFCSQKCYRLWRKENYKPSEETKQKISQATKWREATWKPFEKWHTINNWRTPWNKWLVMREYLDDEQYKVFLEQARKRWKKLMEKMLDSTYRTSIELKLEEIVKSFWIRYLSQYSIMWITVSDIYIPDKRLVIYADWDYWHNYPYWNERDHYITKELKNNNYKVLRFWEREINNNLEFVTSLIKSNIE